MSKPRSCPHCHAFIPFETGFHYDAKLNVICDSCDKIALPSNESDDTYQLFNPPTPHNYSYNPHVNQYANPPVSNLVTVSNEISQEHQNQTDVFHHGNRVVVGDGTRLPSGRSSLIQGWGD